MTKKYLEIVAAIIKSGPFVEPSTQHRVLVEHFSRELAKLNPRFRKDILLKACGIKTTED